MEDIPPYPLYNSTYHLYRVSPLYHGDSPILQERALRKNARRLRDVLKGDNLRGVQVDFASADSAVANCGPLHQCEWAMIRDDSSWDEHHQQSQTQESTQSVTPDTARGILVDLYYARHSYNALLLRDPGVTTSPADFTHLPLLLVRMPAPIREIFLNYLSTTFDAKVSPFKPNPTFLTSTLESHLTHLTDASSSQTIPDIIKVLQLQLSFPSLTSTALKNIDINIARDDVPGFHTRGKLILRGSRTQTGTRSANSNTPFTTALSEYLAAHLALRLGDNKKVYISKVVCGAFALSTDGKIKLYTPPPITVEGSEDGNIPTDYSAAELAMRDLYTSLVREATRQGPFLNEDDSIEDDRTTRRKRPLMESGASGNKRLRGRTADADRAASEAAGAPKTGRDSIPAEPPPPYELHDPSLVSTAV
ncbi:uncharacterized protein BDZ99DRAFT_15491 [Mytilinidion resinicola]|uniref:Uncharacterized protein n=1 Tax=Mytilinidion resinicola TaxID=574789 RepID=A0A6A6Z8S8_9PEZI|nr:uncharacterized protein BDZ99DRAFT_15491 [Mytilinidion resinicola]KAF2817416.1 hypothetical protein BDZ99DRAFT_15491 [Mytilinidion resinicola]